MLRQIILRSFGEILESKKREALKLRNECRRRPSEETREDGNRARKEYKEIRKTREK